MNSDDIKVGLHDMGGFAVCVAAHDYILALEAERDAWRAVPKYKYNGLLFEPSMSGRCHVPEGEAIRQARARVDSFKPPAAPGEGEKA